MKKKTEENKIILALDTIDKSVKNLQRFGSKYDGYIDQAALRGDDSRARQLIRQKIGVYNLAEQLITLKGNIELGAYTAQAMADLSTLPGAMAACKGLLSESPNFNKLGNSIQRIFKDMQKPAEEISKLNDILDSVLSPQPESTMTSRLDEHYEEETNDQFKAEYKAMMERIKSKVTPEMVSKPTYDDEDTGNIDYAGIMEEENKKK